MSKVGIIGYGSMGSMLLRGFIKSGAVAPNEIIVSTRTKSKLEPLKSAWPALGIAGDNAEAAGKAAYIFVCVEPADVKSVLLEIKGSLRADSVVVSIAGSVSMKNVRDLTGAKVIRLIPSLTSEVCEGISLACYGEGISGEERDGFESLLGGISKIKRVREDELGLATVLTSCGPGLFAAMLGELTASALRQNSALDRKDAEDMIMQTFYGTAKVLLEQNMGFDEMVRRVATKGGMTEAGVKALRAGLPETFDNMLDAALEKRRVSCGKIDADFMNRE